MDPVLQLFSLLLVGFIFQSTSARSLPFPANNKTFGPFFRSPFLDVDPSDVQKIDIGELPEVFSKISRIMEHGVELIELPIGTMLHKAMKTPASSLPSQTDIFNIFAAKNSWLANMGGAKQYKDWGYGDIVNFEVTGTVKLFDIASASNWEIIWSRMNDRLKVLRKQKTPPYVSPFAQMYIQQEIDRLLFQKNVIQLTIGYGVTWAEQEKLLLKYGDAITNDFTYLPKDELEKRKCDPNDWFSIDGKPTVLISTANTFGWRAEDLNRVSFTTALDNVMADAITEYVNVDGYYSGKFPSLFHGGGVFNAEIAIHIPRDKLKIVGLACEKGFHPCGSKCYNANEQECLPGGILERY